MFARQRRTCWSLVVLSGDPRMSGRHQLAAPDDTLALDGLWHVGTQRRGSFPHIELNCPCPKAPCGLAAPDHNHPCAHHWGQDVIRQWHHADSCGTHRRRIRFSRERRTL